MPKKQVRTGYYYYMLEMRDELTHELGYTPSMEELRTLASPGWDALSADQKLVYNTKAKEDKKKARQDLDCKFNSMGISFSTVDALSREKQEAEDTMKATIDQMVKPKSLPQLLSTYFYVSHVNYYYKTFMGDEDWYCPCEISIIEFSLQDGITNKFHRILHQEQSFVGPFSITEAAMKDILCFIEVAGELPLGVRADAKEHAEKYHDIHLSYKPGNRAPKKDENTQLMFSDVVNFLRKGGKRDNNGKEILPPVFTMLDSGSLNHSMTAVRNALEKFSDDAHERRDLLRVFPLHQLFFALKVKLNENFTVAHGAAILENELEKEAESIAEPPLPKTEQLPEQVPVRRSTRLRNATGTS